MNNKLKSLNTAADRFAVKASKIKARIMKPVLKVKTQATVTSVRGNLNPLL